MRRKAAIFIGNSIFGDDRIGLLVGEDLRSRLEGSGFDVQLMERTGFALIDLLEGYDSAVVVDSVCMPSSLVGSVRSFSVEDFRSVKPPAPHYSGVPEALELMGDLGLRVPRVSIIGINVKDPYSLSGEVDPELGSMKSSICAEVYEMATRRGGGRD